MTLSRLGIVGSSHTCTASAWVRPGAHGARRGVRRGGLKSTTAHVLFFFARGAQPCVLPRVCVVPGSHIWCCATVWRCCLGCFHAETAFSVHGAA